MSEQDDFQHFLTHDQQESLETIPTEPDTSIRPIIGRVGSPPRLEATSDQFYFWVGDGELVEKTQIVRTDSIVGNDSLVFIGIIEEVFRRSRRQDITEERDEADGDAYYIPQFSSEGVTYALVRILRTRPPILTPPFERSPVYIAYDVEAQAAYGADEIERPLAVGLIKNGANMVSGIGCIDLDYLLGANGGHMNVNGSAGRGTKSSFLLWVVSQLLEHVYNQQSQKPSIQQPLQLVPIILNVKGQDLFYIDKPNRSFKEKYLQDWNAMEIEHPIPFDDVTYYAPQQPNLAVAHPITDNDRVKPYSWSLSDIIEHGLFQYLFADEDINNPPFNALILDIESWLTKEKKTNTGIKRMFDTTRQVGNFEQLRDWVRRQSDSDDNSRALRGHYTGTWNALYRRLILLTNEGRGVLRYQDQKGNPLELTSTKTRAPVVVDINYLAELPSLQRFVVATIIRQLIEHRRDNQVRGLVYIVVLDELNRFAPKGARDPITKLIEKLAAEMRSQGVILLGAQQQASKVSEKVIENSAIRVIGGSGSLEMDQPVWRFLSPTARKMAVDLPKEEKLIIQEGFRAPMRIRVPFPAWAMRREEADIFTEVHDEAHEPFPSDEDLI